jgi:hypothetical protein
MTARHFLHGKHFENLAGVYASALEETGWNGVHLFICHHLEFKVDWNPSDVAERRAIEFGVYGPDDV